MKIFLTACLILWLCAVGCGIYYLNNYEFTPGAETAEHPATFPVASRIDREGRLPTLLIFAHPHCPCTRATVQELSKLMTEAQGRLKARVLFIKPVNFADDWTQTDLWNSAAAIPGVTAAVDDEGREASLFKAETSGIALLYDSTGALRFQGGITASRGHEGNNDGRRSIVDLVTKDAAQPSETFVYGCPLKNSQNCPPGAREE